MGKNGFNRVGNNRTHQLSDALAKIDEKIKTQGELPVNYIYISHLDSFGEDFKFWYLPLYPDTVTDSMAANFQQTQALGRTAPVFTFSNSGPRTVQFNLNLHRDMVDDINIQKGNPIALNRGEDYIESLVHALQSIAVPKYNISNKAIEPPLVAVRLGDEIFIKGVVTTGIGLTYQSPILSNNKYARVSLSFTVTEVDPYDASSVFKNGSFRGLVKTLNPTWGNSLTANDF